METDLSHKRKDYQFGTISDANLPNNPIDLFKDWYSYAEQTLHKFEVNAMTLSTLGVDGYPKGRVVLLKKFGHGGFVFFTNYSSEKGKAIAQNTKVCLSFFWVGNERQVIILGNAKKTSTSESDHYFARRPRKSQLSSIVSNQSHIIASRTLLEDRLREQETTFKNKPLERPSDWGGYMVSPVSIEFWQGRTSRLHDRIRYTLASDGNQWNINRLEP